MALEDTQIFILSTAMQQLSLVIFAISHMRLLHADQGI